MSKTHQTMYNLDEEFFEDLSEYAEQHLLEEEDAEQYADDWCIVAYECDLEPVFTLTADWIIDHIDEERIDEEGNVLDRIQAELLKLDFSEFNSKVPQLWYPSKRKVTFTKADLLEAF